MKTYFVCLKVFSESEDGSPFFYTYLVDATNFLRAYETVLPLFFETFDCHDVEVVCILLCDPNLPFPEKWIH